jgi:hypothetical protein
VRDRGPWGGEPARLLLPADADCTEGQTSYGPYTVTTRNGLVRIDKARQHVGTVKQGRWGLLTAAYDAADVCRTLPRWIAEVEKEELTRGVPSAGRWRPCQPAPSL